MRKFLAVTIIVLTAFILLLQTQKTFAAAKYTLFYSDKCTECLDVLNYIKDNPKALQLDISFVDLIKDTTGITQYQALCKQTSVDNTKANFYNGAKCSVGKTAVVSAIKKLADAVKTTKPTVPADTSTSTPTTTPDTTTSTTPSTDSSTTAQTQPAETKTPAPISTLDIIAMIAAPSALLIIGYVLIKRLKL